MAQTKRKRRSKHRGNAAGTVEARGRTGRKPTDSERKKPSRDAAREQRRFKEPTWGAAIIRAALASVFLILLFQLTGGKGHTLAASVILAALAFLIYVPAGYQIDRIAWKRRMRKAGRPIPGEGKGKR